MQLNTDESISSLSSKIYGPKNILRDYLYKTSCHY